ncbi:MAG: APA family basic amino acid/polyamine antiporter [Planctomycetota bacterium]|jgi:APA family basic amino acid/polyamine antiporter
MTSTVEGETEVPARRQLVRALTLIPAIAIILANIIGTGVFVKARAMIVNVGSPDMVLLVWICAGLLTLTGALVFAELSTMMPRSGGAVNFLGAAYGRRVAFLCGWTGSVAVGASTAAVAILFAAFLNDVLGNSMSTWMLRALPIVVITIAAALNLVSVRATGKVAAALTLVKVTIVLSIGIGAFLFADGSLDHFSQSSSGGLGVGVPESARLGVNGFGAAMLGALWSYNGWAIIAGIGGEVKDPARTLPRTMIGGTLLVIVLYLLINAAYFYVLTPLEISNLQPSQSVANATVLRFAGKAAAALMSVGLVISAYGTLHTTLLVGPRTPFALARKGLMPAGLALVSARGIPVVAVLAVAAWAIVLTLSGTFNILTDIYIFMIWIFNGLVCTALFVLRRKMPDANRPYRVWGYPLIPAIFLVVTLFLLINTFIATPSRAISGFLLVLAGLPVYAFYSRHLSAEDRSEWLGGE